MMTFGDYSIGVRAPTFRKIDSTVIELIFDMRINAALLCGSHCSMLLPTPVFLDRILGVGSTDQKSLEIQPMHNAWVYAIVSGN